MNGITGIPKDVNITSFFSKYRYVYIYGAGKYGKLCADVFSAHNINFNGFIVSVKIHSNIAGYLVYTFDEIYHDLGSDDCLVFAMKKEYQLDVLSCIADRYNGQMVDITGHKLFHREIHKEFAELMEGLSRKYPPAQYSNNDFSNILVIRLDRMGDMIWTSAFLRELRGSYPNAHITLVCKTSNIPLLHDCPYVDKCIGYECTYDEEIGQVPIQEVCSRAKKFAEANLREIKYDAVFLPRGLIPMDAMANVFLAVFSSASVRVAGIYATSDKVEDWYRDIVNQMFSVVAEHKEPLHEVEKALSVLKVIGCTVESDNTEIWYKDSPIIADMNKEQILELRDRFDFLVGIGLTSQSPARIWNPNNYKELFARMGRDFSVGFILLGGPDAKKEAAIAYDEKCCMDFAGKTSINDIMQLISICDIYVGSNTGLAHIAAALKKPVIEIAVSFPWGDDNVGLSPKNCGAWKTKNVVLAPDAPADEACAKAGYCIKEEPHCINNVSVDSVQKALTGFIKYYTWS